jgi:hypothetical protein
MSINLKLWFSIQKNRILLRRRKFLEKNSGFYIHRKKSREAEGERRVRKKFAPKKFQLFFDI